MPPRSRPTFFETSVRPVLAANCYDCHADERMGGLRLDSREGLLKGGNPGPAIVPGDPEKSLLIQAVRQTRHAEDAEGRTAEAGRDRRADGVGEGGRTWPAFAARLDGDGRARRPLRRASPRRRRVRAPAYVITPEQRAFWSFQPLHVAPVPAVSHASWPKTDIDRFVLARLEQAGLAPVRAADKRTLIRRATLDLTGLPPTPEEIDAFEKDASPDAFAKVVDRLLASPHYGETWGRLWLDVARYGEDDYRSLDPKQRGYNPYPNAYLYRDWVIKAFNDDLPYDQFVRAQLAGDLLGDAVDARAHAAGARLPRPRPVVLRQRRGRDHARRRAARSRRRGVARLPRAHGRLRPLPRSQVRSDSHHATTTRWPACS